MRTSVQTPKMLQSELHKKYECNLLSNTNINNCYKAVIYNFILILSITLFMYAFVYISVSVFSSEACAKDFGIQGHVFNIEEQDILTIIEEKLKTLDVNALKESMVNKTRDYVNRPPRVVGITKATEVREYSYDPTYTVPEDIKDHTGKLLHAKGRKVNPLEFVPLKSELIFIDGDDSEQVAFAMAHCKKLEKQNKQAKIILISGSPLDLQKEHNIWIYFDQAGALTKKFSITQVPAIVSQDDLLLKISIIDLSIKSNDKNNTSLDRAVKDVSNKISKDREEDQKRSKL